MKAKEQKSLRACHQVSFRHQDAKNHAVHGFLPLAKRTEPASEFRTGETFRPCIIRKTGQTHGASFFLGSAKLPACGTGNERDKKKPFIISGVLRSRTYPHGQSNAAVPGVILRLHGAPICSILSSDGFRAKRRPRVGRIVLSIFLVLILALGIGVFSAWNWVDDQLNKQTWLTSKADTAGESWLILGSDEREGTIGDAGDVEGFRTDTILVLTKPKTGSSSLISIPRDSLVEIDGSYMKINAVAQLYSRKQLVNEVEDITGQKINHVAMVRFGGLVKVVDALGGVDLCYDQNVNDPYSGMNWTAGCHTVDGNTALAFSRMRYADVQGDFGRAARQRQVINAIVKKGASKQTLTNFNKTKKVAAAALSSVTVDEKASTSSLLRMALAFKSASGKDGISGSVYWTDPDYYVDGVGSCVLLDDAKNIQLFSELSHGTHSAGTVGTLAEQQN